MSFLDHSPAKNVDFTPEDGSGEAANPSDLLMHPEPQGFIPKLKWHYENVIRFKNERTRTLKPWSEFLDRSKFSIPGKVEAFSRANRNLAYFFSNYVLVSASISAYILFTNIWFLTTLVLTALAFYYVRLRAQMDEPIRILGREFSVTSAYVSLAVFALGSFFLSGGSSTLFYLGVLSFGTVLAHAIVREPVQETQFAFV
eukprot:GILI01018348.1.p1 GENE.GILI01018348.1~~GILI01018348.1.p1  ORF type:complete len:200 (+),score=33.04 GILI01018348.1:192-791(+)